MCTTQMTVESHQPFSCTLPYIGLYGKIIGWHRKNTNTRQVLSGDYQRKSFQCLHKWWNSMLNIKCRRWKMHSAWFYCSTLKSVLSWKIIFLSQGSLWHWLNWITLHSPFQILWYSTKNAEIKGVALVTNWVYLWSIYQFCHHFWLLQPAPSPMNACKAS